MTTWSMATEKPIDCPQVDVSMDGIELQDREFFAAIDEVASRTRRWRSVSMR